MSKIESFDLDDPLGRVKGETGRSNHALLDYFEIGPGRSLPRLIRGYKGLVEAGDVNYTLFSQYRVQDEGEPSVKPPSKRLATVERWSSDYQWQARIARYEKLERERRLAIREQRRDQLEDDDWGSGGALRAVAAEFLEIFPRFLTRSVREEEDDDGEKVRVIREELNTTIAQISQAMKVGSDLQRLSTNEPTDITEVHGAVLLSELVSAMDELASGSKDGADGEDDDGGTADPATHGAGTDGSEAGEETDLGAGGAKESVGSSLS